MALANDNFYGYALKLLAEESITWLECAAASLVWTTMIVYYFEKPYGHLLLESMEGPEARTTARGNLFSFALPWEDIEKRCVEAGSNWTDALAAARQSMRLPHDEDVLATLVHVHLVGGAKDSVEALKGAKMRVGVVLSLINELRSSGYPGYRHTCNDEIAVNERMRELYTSKYKPEGQSEDGFKNQFVMPVKIREAAELAYRAKLTGTLIMDKNATPSEPVQAIDQMEQELRPLSIIAERSSKSASTVHEEHANVLARYQTLEVHTGSTMMRQFKPQYLGLAHPWTLPIAVGGYDIPGDKERWRRPSWNDLQPDEDEHEAEHDRIAPLDDPYLRTLNQVGAARVKLFDVTRSLPRRIEAQYRRHWHFVPGLWNLYFREQVNLHTGLYMR